MSEIESLGVEAAPFEADLAHLVEVQALVPRVLERFGRLDLLVNNAGVYNASGLDRVTPSLWEETFAINLRAVFFLCQAAAEPLRAHRNGVIVNLASDGGLSPHPGFPVSAPYAASKAGLIMLTKVLALELAPEIRVNAVAPGVVESKPTPMSEAARAKFVAMIPRRRIGNPRDVANAVAFLASDAADFVTGQILAVDGGLILR